MDITFTQLLTILGLVLGIVSFLAGIIWNIWKRVTQNSRELNEYKLEVAEKYVKSEQLAELEKSNAVREERFLGGMANLTARIDRMLERLDRA